MKSIFRSGIPVMGKNYFPSNIQGLPTWYEIRVTKDGLRRALRPVDIMVAMNAETYARDVRRSLRAAIWYTTRHGRGPALLKREDITVMGVPLAQLCNENFNGVRTRILMKNICYAGVLAALLEPGCGAHPRAAGADLREEAAARRQQHEGDPARLRLREAELHVPVAAACREDGRRRPATS